MKKHLRKLPLLTVVIGSILVSVNSCGVLTTSDYQTIYNAFTQDYNSYNEKTSGTKTNGAYLGIAASDAEAKQLAANNGYPYYKWYASSCQVYGYTSNPN